MKKINFKVCKHGDERGNILAVVVEDSANLLTYELFQTDPKPVSKEYIRRSTRNATTAEKVSLATHLNKLGINYEQVKSLKA